MTPLKDKVIIITGASSGIGRATALECAKRGARVVLAARRVEKLQALCEEISQFNDSCLYVRTDVTQEHQVQRLFDETEERWGHVDILINNAGRGLKQEIRNISFENWRAVLHTNLTSVFLNSREALRRMIAKNHPGHIITVSSIAGLYGTATFGAYCAAKHGVTGFQRSLKWEARKYGIKVSTIFPGRVDTEFFKNYPSRPSRKQMLTAKDLAIYIVTVAEQNGWKRNALRISNVLKRVFYFVVRQN